MLIFAVISSNGKIRFNSSIQRPTYEYGRASSVRDIYQLLTPVLFNQVHKSTINDVSNDREMLDQMH
jgi:hypothetical protein